MPFSNQNKINIAKGLSGTINKLRIAGSVKNNQGAFNLAVINLLQKLSNEFVSEEILTEQEFVGYMESILADEEMEAYNLAKSALEVQAQQRAAEELMLQEKVNAAKNNKPQKKA